MISRGQISLAVIVGTCMVAECFVLRVNPAEEKKGESFRDPYYLEARFSLEKYECSLKDDDVAQNLNDYARFFATGTKSRTRILFIGDSLIEQFYEVIKCAAQVLRMHAEDTAFGTVIKHSANATGGVEINIRKIWKFQGVPDHQKCTKVNKDCAISFADFCIATENYDHVFANLAHHELRSDDEQFMGFEQMAETVFNGTQTCALRKHVHWVGHPPSHFNSVDGRFTAISSSMRCTCDLPRASLEQQPIIKNSQLAERLAHQYGFSYISIWQEFITKCDKHPGGGKHRKDCLHYVVSPANWVPATRQLAHAMEFPVGKQQLHMRYMVSMNKDLLDHS